MAEYRKEEARAWAREHLVGCSAVTIPTFTSDLKRLNEAAIRHDVERAIEHGFTYTLVMTETAITPEEAGRFTRRSLARRGSRLGSSRTPRSGPWTTTSRRCVSRSVREPTSCSSPTRRSSGRPPSRRSTTGRARSATPPSLGVMLFGLPAWGFERIHPAGMSVVVRPPRPRHDPQHRRHQGRAGESRSSPGIVRDVLPLPRRGGDQLPDRGGRDPAHGRHGHAVLRDQQHPVDERLVPTAPSSWRGAGTIRRRWSATGRCSRHGWRPAPPCRPTSAAPPC